MDKHINGSRRLTMNKYAFTMHFAGQSTILTLTADRGTGEAYCLAHHLTIEGEKRRQGVNDGAGVTWCSISEAFPERLDTSRS